MTDAADDEQAEPMALDLEDLYEHAPVGWVTTGRDWSILRANQTLLDWLGRSAKDVLGTHFAALLTAPGRIYHETHHAPLVLHRGRASEVAADLAAEERTIPVLLESRAAVTPDGLDVVHTSVVRVEERRRYERELQAARRAAEASRERLQRLHDATAMLVEAAGVDDVAAVLARAVAPIPGLSHPSVWLLDESREALREVGHQSRAVDRRLPLAAAHPAALAMREGEVVVDRRAGMLAVPIVGAPGEQADGVLTAVIDGGDEVEDDAVEVVRTLAGIAATALERGRLHQRKDEILQAAARDLRTPLATILGHGATLRSLLEDRLERSEASALDRVVETAERMHLLVDGFLELAELEAGRRRPDPRPALLVEVVREAVTDLRAVAEQEQVAIEVAEGPDGRQVPLDRVQVRQAVAHVVLESILRSGRGSQVQVSVASEPGWATVTVRDAGDPTRTPGRDWVAVSRPEHEASTLGLAIARGFVGAHGGTLQVEHGPDGGWAVLRLPVDGPQKSGSATTA